MEMKTFAATLGLGIAAGAAAAFLIPKQSKVYKTASELKRNLIHSFTISQESIY